MRYIFITIFFFVTQTASSKLLPSIQYLYPKPGSTAHLWESPIIVRFENYSAASIVNLYRMINIFGNESGRIEGNIIVSTDDKTIIFYPAAAFTPGETVTVNLAPVFDRLHHTFLDTTYQFNILAERSVYVANGNPTIKYHQPDTKTAEHKIMQNSQNDPLIRNGISIPMDFPWIDIMINDHPDAGYIFLNNWGGQPYNLILDQQGYPIWYMRSEDRRRDFKVQADGRLTMLIRQGYENGSHLAFDSTYTIVDTFFTPAGFSTDEHELQVLPGGHYLLIGNTGLQVDMSDIVPGGSTNAYILCNNIIEMDQDDNPVFIWRCWDHFDVTDATHEDLTANFIDYVHINAIDIDTDGHLLISSRHLDEITKINRQTGEIIWRLGGKNDQFTWLNDQYRLSYQHDIRSLGNNHYTIFDNGNYHEPRFSRALELEVDTINMTVSKVWEFRDVPDKYSRWMGNVQRLPNGNTLINWANGSLPKITEVRPDGTKAYEMNFVNQAHAYRVFKFPWSGRARVPYLLIEPSTDHLTLLFNQFGDSTVAAYHIYGGTEANPQDLIAVSEQPFIHLYELPNLTDYYFQVKSINSQGHESDFSNQEHIFIRFSQAGENLVINGDFSQQDAFWQWWYEQSQASAFWSVTNNGEMHVQIADGGTEYWHVQLLYPDIPLIQGKEYLFEFDAYSDQNKIFSAQVGKDGDPYTDYSMLGYNFASTSKSHFAHQFIMQEPSDPQARIAFNIGSNTQDIFIDNVSLKEVLTDIETQNNKIPLRNSLEQNYPNPFNAKTVIRYQISAVSQVELGIYNILGQKIAVLVNEIQNAGDYQVEWNAEDFASGIYIYQLKLNTGFLQSKKLVMIK